MALTEYNRKRDFHKTREPAGKPATRSPRRRKAKSHPLMFVVQEHHASHLHFDFRLEMDGVLKSWAVPKGPSFDPAQKRLAVEVEDHPLNYGKFQGEIPEGEYGGGQVYIWDTGTWESTKGDPLSDLRKGRLEFELKGKKMKGEWVLIRTRSQSGRKPQWLLIKRHDDYADVDSPLEGPEHSDDDVMVNAPTWESNRGKKKKAVSAKRGASARTKTRVPARTAVKKKVQNKFIAPQLATLVKEPPKGDLWIHETKFDGYRTEAVFTGREVQLLTRTGQDWTDRYRGISQGLKKLKLDETILDGEIVWLDEQGRSDFQLLQNAMKAEDQSRMVYYVFDLLFCDGEDWRDRPLLERKEKLVEVLKANKADNIRYSEHIEGHAIPFLRASCDMDLEGIISKRVDAPYESRRTDSWLKSKCHHQQEFVIGGFTEEKGERIGFGALLVGIYEGKKLRYAGRVGTGFNTQSLKDLKKKFSALEVEDSPFDLASPRGRGLHWVKPILSAEITFANWTRDGVLRVPVFHGLREDKPAVEIHKENAMETSRIARKASAKAKKPASSKTAGPDFHLSHPDKILFEAEGVTKRDVALYYWLAAPWMVPSIAGRPLSLMRCPEGARKTCFFQKHISGAAPDNVDTVSIQEKKNKGVYLHLDNPEGLISLVQMGAFELHVWNSRAPDVMHPDQFVMDFDPGPGVPWRKVVGAAFTLKEMLEELGLKSFVKVTGGKGIHVHVPVTPLYSWDQIRNFTEVLAKHMVDDDPDLFVATMSKSLRNKKIFVDYLRNGFGATAVAPYSLRARENTAVAMPLTWEELKTLKSADYFTLPVAQEWLKKRKADPWKNMAKVKQKIKILKPEK